VAAPRRLPNVRLGAVIALGIAAGLGVWLGTRDNGPSSPASTTTAGPTGKTVVPISGSGLQTLVAALHRPIYWAGEQPGKTYELAQYANGDVYVRYLPPGARIGSTKAFLTVGTYPVANAFSVTLRTAGQSGSVRVPAQGAVAFHSTSAPTNVYLAFPGIDYQIEVYDPSAADAKRLVEQGKIVAVSSTAAAPKLVSAAKLKAVAGTLGHPLYWAGYKGGFGYELRQDAGDKTYVRYLPRGTVAGAKVPALTVGSYGLADAFAVTKRSAGQSGAVQVPVTGGGIAFYSKSTPMSVYIAYPGTNVQIEVYDPSPGRAKELVTTGKIAPVG
jgi:hypothetical protein